MFAISWQAQCFEDRHNGNWFDSWISCEESINPNPDRGESHWIMYDFHHTYSLSTSKIWNLNIPDETDRGMNQVVIDYSVDGTTWTEWGEFTIPEAPGVGTYEGVTGPNFGGIFAKYLIITAINNHGGNCTGFSELRIDVEDVIISSLPEIEDNGCLDISVYPNPHNDAFNSKILSQCPEAIVWTLYDARGSLIREGSINAIQEENYLDISTDRLPSGLYHLVVIQGNARSRVPIVKADF